ncbi:PAS domain-containing protein [Pleurocapsales cyanobacterium LEGE 06147]|nr:PAS domain-containing protein [Pleurocapsales cyanobacterium LEGE 06147]
MTNNNEERVFEELLEYLKRSRGFDFTGYKRSSLMRRVRKQMHSHGINSFEAYLDYLQVHQEEFLPLFNTILINVTGFFRDVNAWKYLQSQIIPRLINNKSEQSPIRVWSTGCASGEEAYILAIILAEILGVEQFRQRVKIYATDVDEEALNQARHASYSDKDVEAISTELQERYFEVMGNRYVFRPDLRRAVIFGRHDLVRDAPISRLDLLVCRNTLMYFNAETQAKILARFRFALNDTGVLFLGKAEMLLTRTNLFIPISLQHRIFSRVSKTNRRDRRLLLPLSVEEEANETLQRYDRIKEIAFDVAPVAQIIVDIDGKLVSANASARSMFGINLCDLDRPLQDLQISYRPLELRSLIEQAYQECRTITIDDVVRNLPDNQTQYLDVRINSLEDNYGNGELMGVSITFTDVTRYHSLQTELHQANQELETANEELQSSNEELETTNEELQSTNEELETTNEELQSTNEELETMNEELHSTNEELQTINDELRLRTFELNQVNAFLKSILASLKAGVIVVDPQFNILSWNKEAENLWGLRTEEVQRQSFFSLDIGLPVDQMREPIRNCLLGLEQQQEVIIEAINRRGKSIQCRVSYNPLIDAEKECQGVILLIEEVELEFV